MKNAKEMPPYRADLYMGKTYDLIEAQLMHTSIELDIYKHLETPIKLENLVKETGYHNRNLELMLNALTAMGFLKKEGNKYSSTPETNYYLNSQSQMYLGEHLLYWRDMTKLGDVTKLVKDGPSEKTFDDKNGSDYFDFRSMGQGTRNAMYLGRVQNFISLLQMFFEKDACIKSFDMGAGSGVMSIEIVRNFPKASAVVFDQPKVTELTSEIIKEYGVENRIEVQSGNFVTDDFHDKYDLIIAAGVLDFVGELDVMLSKLKSVLTDEGYIYVGTHGINDDFTEPKPFVLGWLSSHLNGLDVLKSDPYIRRSIEKAGFDIVYEQENLHCYMIRKKK